MVLILLFPIALVAPGLWLLKVGRIPVRNNAEKLAFSYVLSLSFMFVVLYVGAIAMAFHIASIILLLVVALSSVWLLVSALISRWPTGLTLSRLRVAKLEDQATIIGVIGLLLVFSVVLLLRVILDSDVLQFYLPIAREISRANGLTYETGYDYNILLKPIGVSILYAWTYAVSGDIQSEAFRLMPLVPILVLILLNYAIAREVTNSHRLGMMSAAVFLVMPFQDRLLLYTAFYPDTFYYPLVLTALYCLIRYIKVPQESTLVLVGIALGAAGLLKAQFVYVIIAVFLVVLTVKMQKRVLAAVLCSLTPFLILLPNLLAKSIQREGFVFSLDVLTISQLAFFVFLALLSGGSCYLLTRSHEQECDSKGGGLLSAARKIILLSAPVAALSSLWYINNLLRFGSLIYTSSANLPNYEWALEILEPIIIPPSASVDYLNFFSFFWFMFIDPAVLGFVWLVPLLVGFYFMLRKRSREYNALLLITVIMAVVIFAQVIYMSPETAASTYNPRDIFLLAPLLSITAAFGITTFVSSLLKGSRFDRFTSSAVILFVAYFGFVSYVHSVVVWFAYSVLPAPVWIRILSDLISLFGLSIRDTSFQLPLANRVTFAGNNIGLILAFSVFVAAPLLILLVLRGVPELNNSSYGTWRSLHKRYRRFTSLLSRGIVVLAILSVIVIPRGYAFLQAGESGVTSYPLQAMYGGLNELIVGQDDILEGDLLTFRIPDGLPYYMPRRQLIDLRWPANLAFLKDALLSGSSREAVMNLKQIGIRHFLFQPATVEQLDASLNFTISSIIMNPELAIISRTFGSWNLYALGPHDVEKVTIPLYGWEVDLRYTGSSYSLNSSESALLLDVYPEASDSEQSLYENRVTVVNAGIPGLNISDFDFALVRVEGSTNARILIRFILSTTESMDIVYWDDVYTLNTVPADLSPFSNGTLRGNAFVGLISQDGEHAWIRLLEISFVKVN